MIPDSQEAEAGGLKVGSKERSYKEKGRVKKEVRSPVNWGLGS